MSVLDEPQPAPLPGSVDVNDALLAMIENMRTARSPPRGLLKLGMALKARAVMGQEKYGTRLHANNGRDPVVDAAQEALDGLVYATQAHLEGRIPRALWDDQLRITLRWLALVTV